MPPDLRHGSAGTSRVCLDAVGELDLAAFYGAYRQDGWGRPAYDPAVMVALICTPMRRLRSARAIERRCVEDVAFRVVAANLSPGSRDDRALSRRARAGAGASCSRRCWRSVSAPGWSALASSRSIDEVRGQRVGAGDRTYEQLARRSSEAGAIDAAEDELYGQARGDELPPELVDPATRRRGARVARRDRRRAPGRGAGAPGDARAACRAPAPTGRRPPGRPRERPSASKSRRQSHRPDSRPVKTPRLHQGYNAHAGRRRRPDHRRRRRHDRLAPTRAHLEPMAAAARASSPPPAPSAPDRCSPTPATGAPARSPATRRSRIYGARPARRAYPQPTAPAPTRRPLPTHAPPLATDNGAALYRRRMTMIEPIFGHTKPTAAPSASNAAGCTPSAPNGGCSPPPTTSASSTQPPHTRETSSRRAFRASARRSSPSRASLSMPPLTFSARAPGARTGRHRL